MDGRALIALTVGMLVGDQHLAPWFPFLLLFQLGLTTTACYEMIRLLGPQRAPQQSMCYLGVVVLVLANWLQNYPAGHAEFLAYSAGNPDWIPFGRLPI